MNWKRFSLMAAFVFALPPMSAKANSFQDNLLTLIRKVGVHGNLGVRHPTNSNVTRGVTFGPSVGLSPGQSNGWKYPVALSMFSEDFHSANGTKFGSVRTRAIMAGIGYGWHFGSLSVGPQVEVGYTFNHASLNGDAAGAFDIPGTVTMEVDNAWAIRPEFKAEYFITPKVTFRTSVDYVRLRPDVTVMTPAGPVADHWIMSNVHANFGIGFYPFRK